MNNIPAAIHIALALITAISQPWPAVATAQNAWMANGPEGGTVTALAIDPQTPSTLYAGITDSSIVASHGDLPQGGLFKTTDGGRSWRAMTGLPNVEITDISINPQTPTTMYVGTYGGDLFKSIDGGETWQRLNVSVGSTNPAITVADIAVDPQTANTVYAVGASDVVKSIDGGSTWYTITSGLSPGVAVRSIAINPKTPTTLYIGLFFSPTSRTRGVFKSTDGGETWRASGLTQVSVAVLTIDPQTPTTLYAGTDGNHIFKSTDGGATWSTIREGLTIENVYALAIDQQRTMTLYAGYAGGPQVHGAPGGDGVFKSTDGGATWRAVDTSPANSIVNALVIDPRTPTTVYLGTEVTGIFKSNDGGNSWRAVNTGLPHLGIVPVAIDPQKPTTIYAVAAGVLQSMDGGSNWRAINTGLHTLGINRLTVDPKTPATVYVGTYGAGVFKSTDGGMSWRAINTGLTIRYVIGLALDFRTPTTVYASGFDNDENLSNETYLFKSTDGGGNWHSSKISDTGFVLRELVIDPQTPTTLYAVTTAAGILKSTDAGESWRAANTGLSTDCSFRGPCISVSRLVIDPRTPTTLYAAQTGGVFKSTDGGNVWRPVNNGLTSLKVVALAIDPQTTTTIYAGTYGAGVFKSTDGGDSWKPLNAGLPSLFVWFLAIDPEAPSTVYARTHDGGVYVLRQQ